MVGGVYVLWLRLRGDRTLVVGRLGRVRFPEAVYAYVGSARGPGGLEARLARHHASRKPMRWHIDYLRPDCDWLEVWVCEGPAAGECDWAGRLGSLPGAAPVSGFGASDCRCGSHLLRFDALPALRLPGARRVVGPWPRP